MAVQPSYRASKHTGLATDTKRIRWEKILGNLQSYSDALPQNNPQKRDTVRVLKVKILRALHPPLNGGGGAGGCAGNCNGGGGGGGVIPPTDAQQIVTTFSACSGITDPTQLSALLQLVQSLLSNNLWNSFDAIYPIVGGNATSHSCNLKNVSIYKINWSGGLTHNSNGVTGNGTTGYGDTQFNPTTGVNVFSLNSASIGVYSRTAGFNDSVLIGASVGSTSFTEIAEANLFGSKIATLGLSSASNPNYTETDFSGSIISSRTSSTSQTNYSKSGSNDTSNSVSSLTNNSLYLLANNSSGSPFNFSPVNLAFAFIGSGLSPAQVATLQTIITTYQTALGRNV